MKSVNIRFFAVVFAIVLSLTACTNHSMTYAPVVDANTMEHIPANGMYRVLPNDTLYSIAWRYDLDYRYLATLNHIAPPYHIGVGEIIYLRRSVAKTKKVQNAVHPVVPIAQTSMPVMFETNAPVKRWYWPAHGRVLKAFTALNKGINIGGHLGAPIYATAAGQVVYCGEGLRGYGKLIIIKHNNHFLSAYAHNRTMLVKQGDRVKARQKIAEMGDSGATRVMLHFEIRQNGNPVNPLRYL